MYKRHDNKNAYRISPSRKMIAKWCDPHKNKINKILEIGAGDGFALSYLANKLETDAFGIEPSSEAIEKWNKNYSLNSKNSSKTILQKGVANSLPYLEDSFDMVIFGFCLYLVDRNKLFGSIAEADRVLKSGGFLVIEDFDPSKVSKNKYKHLEGVYAYKQNYSEIFCASNHYSLLNKYSFTEDGGSDRKFYFESDFDSKVSLSLLLKQDHIIY